MSWASGQTTRDSSKPDCKCHAATDLANPDNKLPSAASLLHHTLQTCQQILLHNHLIAGAIIDRADDALGHHHSFTFDGRLSAATKLSVNKAGRSLIHNSYDAKCPEELRPACESRPAEQVARKEWHKLNRATCHSVDVSPSPLVATLPSPSPPVESPPSFRHAKRSRRQTIRSHRQPLTLRKSRSIDLPGTQVHSQSQRLTGRGMRGITLRSFLIHARTPSRCLEPSSQLLSAIAQFRAATPRTRSSFALGSNA